MLRGLSWTYQFVTAFNADRNLIEIPSFYHRQCAPNYPPKDKFIYDVDSFSIIVRKIHDKYFFADGLKEFRRALEIHEGITITFCAWERNWEFHLDMMPTLEQQPCGRPSSTTRIHVWTVELTRNIIAESQPLVLPAHALWYVGARRKTMRVLGNSGQVVNWKLRIYNAKKGLRCVDDEWQQFCYDQDLGPGDEICFYYRPAQRVWEIVIRKELQWE